MIVKIQHRRGSYTDYDPSKVLPGELVVTQSDDPNSSDGEAVYIGTKAGKVKQLATSLELDSKIATALQSAIPEFVDEVTQEAQDAADRAEAAAEHLVTDTTLTQSGKAADAKKTGEEIADLRADLNEIASGMSQDARAALLACFEHVAWIDDDGQDYYDALEAALNPRSLSYISAVYTPGQHVAYEGDSLDSLRPYLAVTAHYADQTTATVLGYTLSGTLTVGTSVVTVTYEGKTTTFNVAVTAEWGSDYTWLYKASDGVLLSAKTDYVTAAIGQGCTEELANNLLHLSVPLNSSNLILYSLLTQTNSNAKMTAKVKFNGVCSVTGGSNFRLQISNGTGGATIYEKKDTTDYKYYFGTYKGSTWHSIAEFQKNTWYTISAELISGTTQVITIDGVEVLRTTDLNTYYCTNNRIVAQCADQGEVSYAETPDFEVAWITYKNNDL